MLRHEASTISFRRLLIDASCLSMTPVTFFEDYKSEEIAARVIGSGVEGPLQEIRTTALRCPQVGARAQGDTTAISNRNPSTQKVSRIGREYTATRGHPLCGRCALSTYSSGLIAEVLYCFGSRTSSEIAQRGKSINAANALAKFAVNRIQWFSESHRPLPRCVWINSCSAWCDTIFCTTTASTGRRGVGCNWMPETGYPRRKSSCGASFRFNS